VLGAFLRKTELDVANPSTFESPARSILFLDLVNLRKREVHSGNHIASALYFITIRERFINFAMYF